MLGLIMSLAISIFLSSIVLGFVALYTATKDRGSWKKIVLWPLAGLVLIASGLWLYNWIEQRPKVATSLWDIPLGATEGDVKFLNGATKNATKDKDLKVDEWTYVFEHYSGLLRLGQARISKQIESAASH